MIGRPLLAAALLLASAAIGLSADEPFAFVQVSSKAQRRAYLASARIWRDPGPLTPAEVYHGPGRPAFVAASDGPATISCRFEKPGVSLGGTTPKFLCRPPGGASLRVKFTDGTAHRNREVFDALTLAGVLLQHGDRKPEQQRPASVA